MTGYQASCTGLQHQDPNFKACSPTLAGCAFKPKFRAEFGAIVNTKKILEKKVFSK